MTYNCFGQQSEENIKKTLDSISKNHLTNLYNKDINSFLNLYNKKYYSLKSREFINLQDLRGRLQKYINEGGFDKSKGLTGNQIVNDLETKIYNVNEIKNYRRNIESSKHNKFKLQEGDYLVDFYFYQEYKEKTIEDGWYGFYRFVDGEWKLVVGP